MRCGRSVQSTLRLCRALCRRTGSCAFNAGCHFSGSTENTASFYRSTRIGNSYWSTDPVSRIKVTSVDNTNANRHLDALDWYDAMRRGKLHTLLRSFTVSRLVICYRKGGLLRSGNLRLCTPPWRSKLKSRTVVSNCDLHVQLSDIYFYLF